MYIFALYTRTHMSHMVCKIFLKIYFNWRLITLQYCGVFCHTLTWISHRCTRVPYPEPPLLSPSPSHPSRLSQCTSFECPFHALNLDCSSISNMVIYMFQCYSLKSSHAPLFPQSPKSVHYNCVSFTVSYIRLLLPSL